MREMTEVSAVAIELNDEYCSKCSICFSVCPFDAITRDSETGEVKIDVQKCQLCGICYSACPSSAIEIIYYDGKYLLRYVKNLLRDKKCDTLILMCRGNSPSTCEVEEILNEKGLDLKEYIPIRLPCVGRVPTEFFFQAVASGIKKIVALLCEENFCRFKEGSKTSLRRLMLGKNVLRQLGFEENILTVISYSRKAVYDAEKCVGCDKCVFVCPYGAINVEPFATPVINSEECVGCGACALVCPHLAIQLRGFEFENLTKLIQRYGESAKKLKKKGVFPVILVICCQWSEFSVLDEPESLLFKKKAVAMEIPCVKSLDPVHVIQALHAGFDGVMAVVCAEEDCKLEKGRETAERNLDVLKKALEKMKLLERFMIFTVSPRCVGEFNQKLDLFFKEISSLPPLNIKEVKLYA